MTWEILFISNKCKWEEIETLEKIKILGYEILNAQQMSSGTYINVNFIISLHKIISTCKHVWRTW